MSLVIILFKFWNYSWLVSFICMLFRSDTSLMFNEVFGKLLTDIHTAILTAIAIYLLLPFTIPYSIANILKK